MRNHAQNLLRKATPNGECLECHHQPEENGYTRTLKQQSHRFVYEHLVGEIPTGLQVLHSCDNRRCINPKHLFLGTQHDNVLDMISKGRRTHKPSPDARRPRLITEEQKAELLRLRTEGWSYGMLVAKYKVTKSTIANYVKGRR